MRSLPPSSIRAISSKVKKLSDGYGKIMHELIEEHVYTRKTVGNLESAKEGYIKGNVESLKDVSKLLKELVELYPMYIEKEDKRFFYPCMEYFTKQEQKSMVQEFLDFDRRVIHEKYGKIGIELRKHSKSVWQSGDALFVVTYTILRRATQKKEYHPGLHSKNYLKNGFA